jgi:hypothetical protein
MKKFTFTGLSGNTVGLIKKQKKEEMAQVSGCPHIFNL